jgi:hypothetical protein
LSYTPTLEWCGETNEDAFVRLEQLESRTKVL